MGAEDLGRELERVGFSSINVAGLSAPNESAGRGGWLGWLASKLQPPAVRAIRTASRPARGLEGQQELSLHGVRIVVATSARDARGY